MRKLVLILCVVISTQPFFCSDSYCSIAMQEQFDISLNRALIPFAAAASAALCYMIWNKAKKDLTHDLLIACKNNNTEQALRILKTHADYPFRTKININEDLYGYTSLMWACRNNNVIISREILRNHATLHLNINNLIRYAESDVTTFILACKYCAEIALDILKMHKNKLLNIKELDIKNYIDIFHLVRSDSEARETLFFIIINSKKLKDHAFSRLSLDALRDKDDLELNTSIDQNELMKIDLYGAYETWIKEKDSQALTDFFVYLPARMLLNMKIIEVSEPYALYDDGFSRSMCTLYEKWFGRDEQSHMLNQVLYYGQKMSFEQLQKIHSMLFRKMLQKQIQLNEIDKEKTLCVGLQLTALSNTYCNSKEHMAAMLGMLISLEDSERKKNELCRRLCMFSDTIKDTFRESSMSFCSSRERTFMSSSNNFLYHFKDNMYQSLSTCFLLRYIYSCSSYNYDCYKMIEQVFMNNEKAVLAWITEAHIDRMSTKDIEYYSNFFRYYTNNPKYLAAWNRKIFGEEFSHEFDLAFAKHIIKPIKTATASDHALYLKKFLADEVDSESSDDSESSYMLE